MNIDQAIDSLSKHQRTVLERHISLLLTVFNNYNHVQDLDCLLELFSTHQVSEWSKGHEVYDTTDTMKIMEIITKTTKNSIYDYKVYTNPIYQNSDNHVLAIIDKYCASIIKYHKYYQK